MKSKVYVIYVLEKDAEVLRFLKSFFTKRDSFEAKYFGAVKDMRNALSYKKPHVLLAGSPIFIDELKSADEDRVPIIGIVSNDVTKGLRSIVRHNIGCYILAPFHDEDLEFKLNTICGKGYWLESLYQEKKELDGVVEIAYMASSTLDPKEVLYLVVKKLSEIIKVSRCSILRLGDDETKQATVVSSSENPSLKNIQLDLDNYPEIRKALLLKKTVVVKDAMKDPLMKPVWHIIEPLGIKSIVVIPVVFRDEVIGSLFLRTLRKDHVFTGREIKLFRTIASACANALYNSFLFEKVRSEKENLEKLAITDYLTGVYNIRYLYYRLEEEFNRAQRYGAPLSCLMFDIDFFKRVNDKYGHRVGDIVLREFAQLIKSHCRKSDVFARYGGEEFIMILPQTSLKGGQTEGERLCKIVREHRFKELSQDYQITMSVGLASMPHRKINTHEDIITWADYALFKAKHTGRDQLVVFNEE